MRRRGPAAAAVSAIAVLLVATGCATGDPAAPDGCDEPELTWSAQEAAPGDVVTLHGSSMTTGCPGPESERGERKPMRVTDAELVVDGDTVVAAPTVAEGFGADADGNLQMQLTVPADVAPGAELTVELTEREGTVVRSDDLRVTAPGS